jgi:flagellin
MSVINTNVKSLVAQNAMTVNNRSMDKAMQQLSTGKRINSAADDAAGLAIGNKMTAQIQHEGEKMIKQILKIVLL